MNGDNERAAKATLMCANAGCSGRANQSCMRLLCSLCCRKEGSFCRAHRSRSATKVKPAEDSPILGPLPGAWDQQAATSLDLQGRQLISQAEASSQQNVLSKSELQALWNDDDMLEDALSPPNPSGFGNEMQAGRAGDFSVKERQDVFNFQQPSQSVPPSDLGTDAYTISVGSSLIADLERDAKQKTQGASSGGAQFYQQLAQVLSANRAAAFVGRADQQGTLGLQPSWPSATSQSNPLLSNPSSAASGSPLDQYRLEFSKTSPLNRGASVQQELSRAFPLQSATPPLSPRLGQRAAFNEQQSTWPLGNTSLHSSISHDGSPHPMFSSSPGTVRLQSAAGVSSEGLMRPNASLELVGGTHPGVGINKHYNAGGFGKLVIEQTALSGGNSVQSGMSGGKRSPLSPPARKRAKKSPVMSPPPSSSSSPPVTSGDIPSAPVLGNLVARESLPPASIPILLMQLKALRSTVPPPLQKQVLASNRPLQILAEELEAQSSVADVSGTRPDVSNADRKLFPASDPERPSQAELLAGVSEKPLSPREQQIGAPSAVRSPTLAGIPTLAGAPSLAEAFLRGGSLLPCMPAEPLLKEPALPPSQPRGGLPLAGIQPPPEVKVRSPPPQPRGGVPLAGIQPPPEVKVRSPRGGLALLDNKVYPLQRRPAERQAGGLVPNQEPQSEGRSLALPRPPDREDLTTHGNASVVRMPKKNDSQADVLLFTKTPSMRGALETGFSQRATLPTLKDAELQWSAAVGRKPDLDDDSALTIEESVVDRAKHRLRETTQLMQQLLPAQPAALEGASLQDREASVFLTARDAATWPESTGHDADERKSPRGEYVNNEELAARVDDLRRHVQRLEEAPAGVEVLQQILSFDQAQTAGLGLTSEQLERRAASLQRKTAPRLPTTVGRPDRRKPHQVVTSFSDLF